MKGEDARVRRVRCCPECAIWQEEGITCLIPLSESFSASLSFFPKASRHCGLSSIERSVSELCICNISRNKSSKALFT